MRSPARAAVLAVLLLSVLASAALAERQDPPAIGDANTVALPLVLGPYYSEEVHLVNGSFEEGWTDMPPAPGSLINQQPNGWKLSWLWPGDTLWDSNDPITGVPELVHKLKTQLPPNEWPGAPNALILDGEVTYKMFHRGAAFGAQLTQRLENMPPGVWRLTVPVQIHLHENLDPDGDWDAYTVESGVWVLTDGHQSGGWVHAKQMGDHKWYYQVVEFNTQAGASVDVLIRVKSKYLGPKDFFIDNITLEKVDTAAGNVRPAHGTVWRARPLAAIPASERVSP